MTSNPKKASLVGWDLCALAVLFLPACYLHLWKTLQTHLIYGAFGDFIDFPVFSPGRAFLCERLAAAGGPVRYVADFLSQGFHNDAVGALVLTAVAFALYLATLLLLRLVSNLRSHVFAAVPAVSAIALYGDYSHHLLGLLALLLVVACAAAWIAFRPRNKIAASACFAVVFVLLYWAAAAASLLFAGLVALTDILTRRWLTALADIAVAVVAAYLMGTYLFLLEMPGPFAAGLPVFPLARTLRTLSPAYLCLYFPAAILLAAAAGKVLARNRTLPGHKPAHRGRRKDSQSKPRSRVIPAPLAFWLKTAVAAIVIAGGSVVAIRYTHDLNRRHVLRMNDLLQNRQWQAYLDASRTFYRRGFWNVHFNHDTNRALYHTGRLLDEMFSFDQNGAALMIITADPMRFTTKYLRVFDLFFELGNLNDAEKWAYELLETEAQARSSSKSSSMSILPRTSRRPQRFSSMCSPKTSSTAPA